MPPGPQPNPYGAQQLPTTQAPPTQLNPSGPPPPQPATSFGSSYHTGLTGDRTRTHPPPLQAAPPTSAPRPPNTLPRLNTVEMQIQPPPTAPSTLQLPGQHPLPHAPSAPSDHPSSSPTIYFHHWVPPTSHAHRDPPTPSGKSQHESPYSQHQASHLRSEYQHSPPKKRKATGGHQPAPPPTSNPAETSPPFPHASSGRRRGHSRQRSDASLRALPDPSTGRHRPSDRTESGRQSLSEAESGSQRHQSAQPEPRHGSHHPAGSDMRAEPRDRHDRNSPKREAEAPS